MLDRIYMQILDMSVQASLVILIVILVRLLLKRAPKIFSYVLWGVVLFRLLCPVSIEATISVVPDIESVSESYTLQDQPITAFSAGMAAYRAVGDALNGGVGVQQIYTNEIGDNGMPRVVTASWGEVWILFSQYVWLMGIAGLMVYSVIIYCKLRKKLIGASPVRDNIYLADHIHAPFVLGFLKPKIYLPSTLGSGEQTYVVAHEQQHIRRLDHVVKLVAYMALTLHWFNPLVWAAYLLFCKDMEMSCDEAVIRKLGEEIRADYSASLLNLATGRRTIAITPLAFGEGDAKGRIRNLSKWRKPLTWVIVVSVMVCAAVTVCLLTDPHGAGYGRVEKITNKIGYSIVSQNTKEITLTLSTADLPDSIYSEEGCVFEDGRIIAYNDGANKIYLKGARYSNEGTENLYFYFEFEYHLPRDGGRLIYPLAVNQEDYTFSAGVADGILRTGNGNMDRAVKFRGQDSDERIWFYISTDALKQIEGAFGFDIRINQITYLRDGAVKELLTSYVGPDTSGSSRVVDTSSQSDASEFTLEVSLPKTNFSHRGELLVDLIRAEWERYDNMTEFDRAASSHLPGVVYINTETWGECECAIGVAVSNPLEYIDWIGKTGYMGMESVNPSMPITHVKATAYATQKSGRELSRVDIRSGYDSGDVRITLTATICAQDNVFTTGMAIQGYAAFDSKEAITGSGISVMVVTPDIANNTGYYNDSWCDQVAYWVEGNIFYTLRVVGDKENREAMQDTLQRLLAEL